MRVRGGQRRQHRGVLVGVAAVIGFLTGLLANGGGFLLVPAYMLLFGLRMRQAAGTSLLVVIVLAIPTLLVHWSLGHIDWAVAAAFALGAVPMAVSREGSRMWWRATDPAGVRLVPDRERRRVRRVSHRHGFVKRSSRLQSCRFESWNDCREP